MITTKQFEIDHLDRVFQGECEIDWGFEPAQRGGMTDPSWDAYYYINEVKIKWLEWTTYSSRTLETEKGDRNWLRFFRLISDLEEKLQEEYEDLQPEKDDSYSPDEPDTEVDEYELNKAQNAYDKTIYG